MTKRVLLRRRLELDGGWPKDRRFRRGGSFARAGLTSGLNTTQKQFYMGASGYYRSNTVASIVESYHLRINSVGTLNVNYLLQQLLGIPLRCLMLLG